MYLVSFLCFPLVMTQYLRHFCWKLHAVDRVQRVAASATGLGNGALVAWLWPGGVCFCVWFGCWSLVESGFSWRRVGDIPLAMSLSSAVFVPEKSVQHIKLVVGALSFAAEGSVVVGVSSSHYTGEEMAVWPRGGPGSASRQLRFPEERLSNIVVAHWS